MLEPAHISPLSQVLAAHDLSWDRLRCEAEAIALFGSRAAGCERPSSDWDLLCIGRGRSRKLPRLDLVWLDAHATAERVFLGGDLAGHTLTYGTWLHGSCPWRAADLGFGLAMRRKEERLTRQVRSLACTWHLLGPAYGDKHATLLRRDVQRLAVLGRGEPVPPTAHLDRAWMKAGRSTLYLREALVDLGATPPLATAIAARAEGL